MRHTYVNKKKDENNTKVVNGCRYWWNVPKQQWEGLMNNAKGLTKRPKTKFEWKQYYDSL